MLRAIGLLICAMLRGGVGLGLLAARSGGLVALSAVAAALAVQNVAAAEQETNARLPQGNAHATTTTTATTTAAGKCFALPGAAAVRLSPAVKVVKSEMRKDAQARRILGKTGPVRIDLVIQKDEKDLHAEERAALLRRRLSPGSLRASGIKCSIPGSVVVEYAEPAAEWRRPAAKQTRRAHLEHEATAYFGLPLSPDSALVSAIDSTAGTSSSSSSSGGILQNRGVPLEGHVWMFLDLPKGVRLDVHLHKLAFKSEDSPLLQTALDEIGVVSDYLLSAKEHLELGKHFFTRLLDRAEGVRELLMSALHHFQSAYSAYETQATSSGTPALTIDEWRCVVNHLGILLSSLGNPEEALAILSNASEEDPSPSVFYSLACVRAELGHREDALRALQSAARMQLVLPNDLQVLLQDPSKDLAFKALWPDVDFQRIASLFVQAESC
jgi:tetratricopeptide (TPR) repeat protein